jgi:hypothetical protein
MWNLALDAAWHPFAGRPPILHSTHAFSIGLDQGQETDDFDPKIIGPREDLRKLADWVGLRPAYKRTIQRDEWTVSGPPPTRNMTACETPHCIGP